MKGKTHKGIIHFKEKEHNMGRISQWYWNIKIKDKK